MPKKQSKADRESLASYNAWIKDNKKLEKMGMYGADYYVKKVEILEAKEIWSKTEIRKAYKALIKILHPDMNGGDRSQEEQLQQNELENQNDQE